MKYFYLSVIQNKLFNISSYCISDRLNTKQLLSRFSMLHMDQPQIVFTVIKALRQTDRILDNPKKTCFCSHFMDLTDNTFKKR